MRAAVLTASATACLMLAGCGDEGAAEPGGDVPITQRAIAAVALEPHPDERTMLVGLAISTFRPVGVVPVW